MSVTLPNDYVSLRKLIDFMVDEPYFNDQFERYLFLLQCIHPYLDSVDSPKILDVGIFPGHLSLAVKNVYGASVDGIQYKPEPEFDDLANSHGFRIHILDAEREPFPFPDGMFNLVIATEILEHFYSPKLFLSEILRVLKPGGHGLFSTPNQASFYNRFQLMFNGRSVFEHLHGIDKVFNETEWVHKREYTGNEVEQMLSVLGYEDVAIRYCHPRQLGRKKQFPTRWIKNLMLLVPSFRSDLVVLAAKKNG